MLITLRGRGILSSLYALPFLYFFKNYILLYIITLVHLSANFSHVCVWYIYYIYCHVSWSLGSLHSRSGCKKRSQSEAHPAESTRPDLDHGGRRRSIRGLQVNCSHVTQRKLTTPCYITNEWLLPYDLIILRRAMIQWLILKKKMKETINVFQLC